MRIGEVHGHDADGEASHAEEGRGGAPAGAALLADVLHYHDLLLGAPLECLVIRGILPGELGGASVVGLGPVLLLAVGRAGLLLLNLVAVLAHPPFLREERGAAARARPKGAHTTFG